MGQKAGAIVIATSSNNEGGQECKKAGADIILGHPSETFKDEILERNKFDPVIKKPQNIDYLKIIKGPDFPTGGKIVGAGGGGFLMFVANDKAKLRKALISAGLEEVHFKFDFEGTKLMTV